MLDKMKSKKKIRENFRNSVFKRDGYKCKFCKETITLDAHHITDRKQMPNGGYVIGNGITLCQLHHQMAEDYHINCGDSWIEGFHPNNLYKAINSCYEEAYKQSVELGE